MTNLPAPQFTGETSALCAFCLMLIPLVAVGLTLLNAGMSRSRGAAHSMATSMCAMSVAAISYFVCGFAIQGFAGMPSHVVTFAGHRWDWMGAGPFLMRHFDLDGSPASLAACFGMLSTGIAALIPLGAGVERWRLKAICASSALLGGFIFPWFAHWVLGGGWLAQIGANYQLGYGFLDVGGSACVQAVGGLTALSIAWILGPRRGKYSSTNLPNAIPAHNAVLVICGSMLCWVGWLGLNSAGSLLFGGARVENTILVVVNTTLAAASSGLAVLIVTGWRFGRPDVSLTANGWIGGLAASSAGCLFMQPAEIIVVGAIAGVLVTYAVEVFEFVLKVDDPVGSISAHAAGGMWGLMAAGLLARFPAKLNSISFTPGTNGSGQVLAQLVGIATLLGAVLPMTFGLNWFLNRFLSYRASPDGESQGMDLYELGAGAYPEFVVHSEEFIQR